MKKLLISMFLMSSMCFSQTPCNNGFAGTYPCDGFDLIAHLDLDQLNADSGNDSWGWTDPLDGKEYALIGLNNGTAFVDISSPASPVYLGKLPTHTDNSSWRDMKVYNNYAFIVSEASGHGMQVFDLTKLRNVPSPPEIFSEDAHYSGFGNAHNIVINPSEPYAYAVGTSTFSGGPHVVDISDPLNPVFAGGYADDFYSHDAQVLTYSGPDSDYQNSEIYIGSNEDEVVILDVTDRANITNISTISYSNIGYTHQAWLTEDETYLILGDEFDELQFGFNTRSIIFDLSDLDNPTLHMDYVGNTSAIDHNGYVKDGLYYQASYTSGLRVIDVSDLANQNMTEVGFFDSYPQDDALGFNGLWNVYPFFDSGNLILSDIDTGFYLVKNNNTLADENFEISEAVIYPNPSEGLVNVQLKNQTINSIEIFNQLGQKIYADDSINEGHTQLNLSEYDSGIYLIQVNGVINQRLIVR